MSETPFHFPSGKRYNSYVGYFRARYGERLQKVVLDGAMSCPNRDGTLSFGGCTYCDNAAFHPAYSCAGKDLWLQIDEGIEFHQVRYRKACHYLAYFQSFSNTYAPLERLRTLYERALSHPAVVGLVIGTRPDCVDDEKLDYLQALSRGEVMRNWEREIAGVRRQAPIVIVEYGIESCYDTVLERINRGHDFACAQKAVEETARRGIQTGAHFILGLPGESIQQMWDACEKINALPLHSVKFHQLQIVKGTQMEQEFAQYPEDFERFTLDEYVAFFAQILRRLRPDLYIERVAGEVPPRFVHSTPWGLVRNADILKKLDDYMEAKGYCQGDLFLKNPPISLYL
ncbi:MAG: TIGR01212 family radical SAM protein [Bacteroidales bacterium]|nr:TIGR01212 family radical SAM protein [Bacteroidales bacterium]